MSNPQLPTVGIDDMAAYVPKLYLPIETLAEARQIEYIKQSAAMIYPLMDAGLLTDDSGLTLHFDLRTALVDYLNHLQEKS